MTTNRLHILRFRGRLAEGDRAAWVGRCLGGFFTFLVCFAVYATFAFALYWFALSSFQALQTNGRQQIRLCEHFNFATCSRFTVRP